MNKTGWVITRTVLGNYRGLNHMDQDLLEWVFISLSFFIAGFYITKYAYKPQTDDYRAKIVGPSFILYSLIAAYKAMEICFGW